MLTEIKFPTTRLELAEAFGDELARFPASFAEYCELLEEADFRADFHQNEIIAMSYEADFHSDIMVELTTILKRIFPDRRAFKVHNSNRPIACPDGSVFNPDGSVVAQPPVYFKYGKGFNAETTPVLLFEILSPSTRNYDRGTKLPLYQEIEGLQYIIFLEQDRPFLTVWERKSADQWLETRHKDEDAFFEIFGHRIELRQIYEMLFF